MLTGVLSIGSWQNRCSHARIASLTRPPKNRLTVDAAPPKLPNMSLGVSRRRPDPLTAELRAMAHPVRLRILSLLTGAALTAADVARELGLTHANASYHLRQLLAVGQIEVAGQERIRGGAAKRYRYDAWTGRWPGTPSRRRTRPGRTAAGPLRRAGGRTDPAGARLPLGTRSISTSPTPSCGSRPRTWIAVRAMVDEASAAPAPRGPPGAHARARSAAAPPSSCSR